MNQPLELFLFEHDVINARHAVNFGIQHFLVDWEHKGKASRQTGFDTEIRPGTTADLDALSSLKGSSPWCRINHYGEHSSTEVEEAVMAGAEGIFLPMVKTVSEVEQFLSHVDGRCKTGILLETTEAYGIAEELATLPFERVYLGLNDFAISRGGGSIFCAIRDGSVEKMRDIFSSKVFGFGGVTAIDAGAPIPATYLLQEMSRLNCHFSFMRRSFRRDSKGKDVSQLLNSIQAYWKQCNERSLSSIQDDHKKLENLLNDICR